MEIFKNLEESLLSAFDLNILQNIFIELVHDCECNSRIREAVDFTQTCKLFLMISKQKLFPLNLNQIGIVLPFKKYLNLRFVERNVQQKSDYLEKDINALFYDACRSGYHNIITILLKAGANINYKQGDRKWPPLTIATIYENTKTVKKLIKQKDLDINAQNKLGRTALLQICHASRSDLLKILLSRKDIDINRRDTNGISALDVLKDFDDSKMIKILQNYQNYQKI